MLILRGLAYPNKGYAANLISNLKKGLFPREECKKYVQEAVAICEGIPCIGWDIAVTSDGPTIVEVNEGTEMEVIEVSYNKGFRRIMRGEMM